MAPRSFLSLALAALVSALFVVPASAQGLRATAVRALGPESAPIVNAPALAPVGDGFLAAWRDGAYTVAVRPLDAGGAPTGPQRTVPKSTGIWHPMELHLLPAPDGALLVSREVEDGSGYGRVALRKLALDGTPAAGQPLLVFGTQELTGVDALRLADGSVLVSGVSEFDSGDLLRLRRVRPDGTLDPYITVPANASFWGTHGSRTALAPDPATGGALLAYNAGAASGYHCTLVSAAHGFLTLERADPNRRRPG